MGNTSRSTEQLMAFSVMHIDGSMELPNDDYSFVPLLAELDGATAEHGDVAIGHESGWTLTVLAAGRVVWENVEEDSEPRHRDGLSRDEILELMTSAASGDVAAIEFQTWDPGYGP